MEHGGNKIQAARLFGFQPSEMIDLSTGISPRSYPLDPSQFTTEDLIALPQAEDEQHLVQIMRSTWSVADSADITLGPGSSVLISLLPHLYHGRAHRVLCPNPGYTEHEIAWRDAGFTIVTYAAGEVPAVEFDQVAAIVAVQPGNPMGNIAQVAAWKDLMDQAALHDVMVVMDEAFIDLMPEYSLAPHLGQKGCVVVRSLGKFYGLAGVRLGAALGHPDDMASMRRQMGPWAVSTMALHYGAQAIADTAWADDQRRWLSERMSSLKSGLADRGVTILGSTNLYCLIEVNEAAQIQEGLAKQGFWTRIFNENPRWIRLGLAVDDDVTARFFTAWDRL
jgi:cobalamin biosynthetic protein CobC